MRFPRKTVLLLPALALLLVSTPQVGSASITYLTVGNLALNPYPQEFGWVETTLINPTLATVKFISHSELIYGYRYSFGDGGLADFNLADNSSVAVSVLGATFFHNDSPDPPVITSGGSGNIDGFGVFNRTYNGFDGYTYSVKDVTFQLERTSGTWADESSIFADNGDGHIVAAHIFVTQGDDYEGGAVATGFATGGEPPVIPEPTTAILFGLVLLGGALVRFRKRA